MQYDLRVVWLVGWAVLGTAAGCSGTISAAGQSNDDDDDDARSGQPGGAGSREAASCDTGIGPAPLRRLSRSEYQASVRDLFGDLAVPPLQVQVDPAEHGFENRASLLNPSPLLIEQYDGAAEARTTVPPSKVQS